MSSLTPIQQFYKDKTIFLTGFTGFLGHSIFEKLLRLCPDIKRVYLLVRPKKGLDAQQRLEKLLNNFFFDRLKKERPNFMDCVTILHGNLFEENLGLSEKDIDVFLNEVNIVIHSAATVKFDEKMKIAVKLNICSTASLIELVKKCKYFQSFVHISTAYSNCYRHDIDEQFYEPKVDPWEIIEKVNNTNEGELEAIKEEIIGEHPNTYTFTKNLAEHVVKTKGKGLPICVVRPSVVLGANEEPFNGWTGSNITGPFGIMVGYGAGIIRVLNIDAKAKGDVIPVDTVANAVLAAGYNTAQKTKHSNMEVYNIVSGKSNPITWGEIISYCARYAHSVMVYKSLWSPMMFLTSCIYWSKILQFILHVIPAHILDFLYFVMGKKPFLVDTYKKVHTACDVTRFFMLNSWDFNDDNTRKLYFSLHENDQKIFNFDITKIEWDLYFIFFDRGLRSQVLHDPLSTIPKGIQLSKWRNLVNFTVLILLVYFTSSTIGVFMILSVMVYIVMCSY